jgi:hypothetical protein
MGSWPGSKAMRLLALPEARGEKVVVMDCQTEPVSWPMLEMIDGLDGAGEADDCDSVRTSLDQRIEPTSSMASASFLLVPLWLDMRFIVARGTKGCREEAALMKCRGQ